MPSNGSIHAPHHNNFPQDGIKILRQTLALILLISICNLRNILTQNKDCCCINRNKILIFFLFFLLMAIGMELKYNLICHLPTHNLTMSYNACSGFSWLPNTWIIVKSLLTGLKLFSLVHKRQRIIFSSSCCLTLTLYSTALIK